MIRPLLHFLSSHLRARVITDRATLRPYLTRFFILGVPLEIETFDETGQPPENVRWSKLPLGLFLHRFHQSDQATDLHNHPWRWALSFVLAGGYSEERRDNWDNTVRRRTITPGSFNLIRANDFHRVDLLEYDSWSIFLHGPRTQSWGFWDRKTGDFLNFRDFFCRCGRAAKECSAEVQGSVGS